MELALNLVWVCVAIAGILAMAAMLKGAASDGPTSTRQKTVAMCCALVILFFVISMTDDLHGEAILFEEKKPSRVLLEAANPAPPSIVQAVPFVFLLRVSYTRLTVDLPALRRPIDPSRVLVVAPTLFESIDGRAPPLWLAGNLFK